jgi:oligopeptide/dipeptide ABC transporter ATP-binding protein
MKRVVVLPRYEDSKLTQLLIANQVDCVHNLQNPADADVVMARNPKIAIRTADKSKPWGWLHWWPNALSFNDLKPPYDDREIRWAINYAIDRKAIVDVGFQGQSTETLISATGLHADAAILRRGEGPSAALPDRHQRGVADPDGRCGRIYQRPSGKRARPVARLPRRGARVPVLSGGMRQRVCIAIAISLGPQLIIADEPTSALDVVVQRQIMQTLSAVQKRLGASIMLVGHDMGLMAKFVDRVGVMYGGRLVEIGPVRAIFQQPLHPYTQLLISNLPTLHEKGKLHGIAGAPPSLLDQPSGCIFHPRCPQAMARCSVELPVLRELRPGHWVSCHLYPVPAGPTT